jgi:DNA-binding NtrC family response regulator
MIMEGRELKNAHVLVLEDDYYQAMDLQDALERAGATVVGPFADTSDAAQALEEHTPDCALVDLNLGQGLSFELPQELQRRSVPFAFITGYDDAVIPDRFLHHLRAQKPIVTASAMKIVQDLLSTPKD